MDETNSWRPGPDPTRVDPVGAAVHGRGGTGPSGGAWGAPTAPVTPAPPTTSPWAARRRPRPTSTRRRPAWTDDGAAPQGRRWVTVSLGLAAVAVVSAQPVSLVLALGLLVAPVLATVGDVLAQPHRSPAWVPLWWLRNVGLSAVRSLGPLVVLGIGLCLWFGTDAFDAMAGLGPWVLRVSGLVAAGLMVVAIGRGGPGFRTHVVFDVVTTRLLPQGRPTIGFLLLGLVCATAVVLGLSLQPEAWPLR